MFYFHPYLGRIPILTNMFQRGWNHQPENEWQNDWNPGFRFVKSFAAQQQLHRRKPTAIGCNFTLGEMIQLTKSFQMGWNHQPPPSSFFPCFMSNVPCHLLGGWTYPCKLSIFIFDPTSSNIIIVPPPWCLTLSRSWLHSDVWIFYPETSGTWFPIWGAYVFVKGVGQKPRGSYTFPAPSFRFGPFFQELESPNFPSDSRWWFRYLLFSSLFGEDSHFD